MMRPIIALALAVTEERAVVWAAGAREGLVALADKGDRFEATATAVRTAKGGPARLAPPRRRL